MAIVIRAGAHEDRLRKSRRWEAVMEWRRGRRSANVQDVRGGRPGLGGRGMRVAGGGGLGIIGIAVVAMLLGVDPSIVMNIMGALEGAGPQVQEAGPGRADEGREFVAAVLGDTEDTWNGEFSAAGEAYQEPQLVLFEGAVQSACGFAQSATGPFYCPGDRKVYLDLAFFDELASRFGAPGDFAQAYVIAHEVGHHVQTLLGISAQVREAQAGADEATRNQLSVRMELQADCYAGIWAFHADRTRGLLEPGDIEEGLAAASAVGDDRIQQATRGTIVPDAFTHGSSEQRMRWFRTGFESGDVDRCDTFQAGQM